ncbi:MAG TPA: tetratricopeptide repeat protein [Flavobacteriales bacterium]|nr:tetratricopeptide repeat protein [Flavobacteriales bacterium]
MRFILILPVLFVLTGYGTALGQEINLDSLSKTATSLIYSNPGQAKTIALKIVKSKTAEKSPQYISRAYKVLGAVEWRHGNLKPALTFFYLQRKFALIAKNPKDVASSLNNLGLMYINLGSYEKALKLLFEAKKTAEKSNNKEIASSILNNIGLSYERLGNDSTSLEYYLEAAKKTEQSDQDGLAIAYNNVGWQYSRLKKTRLAIEYYKKSIDLAKHLNNTYAWSLATSNLAEAYNTLGMPDTAYALYENALSIAQKNNEEESIAAALMNMANINFYNLGKKQEGLKMMQQAVDILYKNKNLSRGEGYIKRLAMMYEKSNDLVKAGKYYKLYSQIRDSLMNEQKSRAITELQIVHEVESKQKEIAYLNKKQELTNAKVQQQRMLIYIAVTGIVLLVLFLLMLYNRYSIKHRANKKIAAAYKEVEYKNREITDSINYARRLQEAILPPEKLIQQHLNDFFILFKPKDIIAGDFYFFEAKDHMVFIAAGDCTGHGVPGAMVSVVCSNALSRCVKEFNLNDPGKILDKTRSLVLETFEKSESEVKDGMDISFCAINMQTLELKWAGAHNSLFLIQNGLATEVTGDKMPIGKSENTRPFTTHSLQLARGNSFYMFTDGFADQFGGKKQKKFKASAMHKLIVDAQDLSMHEQKTRLLAGFESWRGGLDQVDDVCIIGIKI